MPPVLTLVNKRRLQLQQYNLIIKQLQLQNNLLRQKKVVNPPTFLWGAASSAFQIEGSPTGLSIWDDFCKSKDLDPSVSCDSYNKYKDDIQILKKMGLNSYRLSISWPRLFKTGKVIYTNGKSNVDKIGLEYYKNVFAELKKEGITPIVTLFHWDLPSALQNEYNGWQSGVYTDNNPSSFVLTSVGNTEVPMIAKDFADYAEFCFKTFKDVQYWGSINEAQTYAIWGNEFASKAPAVGAWGVDSVKGVEYRVGHNMLLAHAEANIRLNNIRKNRNYPIYFGMMNNGDFGTPIDTTNEVIQAAELRNVFWLGWFNDPVFFGDYPPEMKNKVNDGRLPTFTVNQKNKIKGSSNIMYINTYTSKYVTIKDPTSKPTIGWFFDAGTADQDWDSNNYYIGKQTQSSWNYIVPLSMKYLPLWYQNRYSGPDHQTSFHGKGLRYFVKRENGRDIYNNIPAMVTENGLAATVETDPNLTYKQNCLNDYDRIKYYSEYLDNLAMSVKASGIILKGYLAWSMCDNFEWEQNYKERFGLCYVNVEDPNWINRERTLKKSGEWYGWYANNYKNGPVSQESFITYTSTPQAGYDVCYYNKILASGIIKP